jgi:hypothetical protein
MIVIPYRDGSTKARLEAGAAVASPKSRWEIGNFGLLQSVKMMVVTGGCDSSAPRVVLRFEGLKNEFRT